MILKSCKNIWAGADSYKALIKDIEGITVVLTANLPDDFVTPLSKAMMPPLMSRVRELWLDRAIPPSLEDMEQYKSSLGQVHELADMFDALHWPGTDTLHDWVKNAPRIWLNKRKETELDRTRNQVSIRFCLSIFGLCDNSNSQERSAKRQSERTWCFW